MTLVLELDSTLMKTLEDRAAEKGSTAEALAEATLRQGLAVQECYATEDGLRREKERQDRIDDAIRRLSTAAPAWSREGKAWKELSHEGHKY